MFFKFVGFEISLIKPKSTFTSPMQIRNPLKIYNEREMNFPPGIPFSLFDFEVRNQFYDKKTSNIVLEIHLSLFNIQNHE